ncbi:MAG: RNA pyrophosphohydrolase [Chromatiales bacterium]|nr:RNA pyrophosphohydrolase [Chromatiales bacterium]
MQDDEGYRLGVGMVIRRPDRKILWCKRVGMDAWQFPQGGIERGESAETAMWRELNEEVGLLSDHVELLQTIDQLLCYEFPSAMQMSYKGQKQTWFLLEMLVADDPIDLTESNEFDQWCWVDWWYPLDTIVAFKRQVYRRVLESFSPHNA